MSYIRCLFQHATQKISRYQAFCSRMQFGEGHLADAVDRDKEILEPFCGMHLDEIDV